MTYLIDTTKSFIIDGDEMNAGDRAFAVGTRTYILDGNELGTSSQRMFLKDHRVFVIDGGAAAKVSTRVADVSSFAISGRNNNGVAAHTMSFVISGRLGLRSLLAMRLASSFVIDNSPQEPAP
jgi:hypothetical protein